MDKEEDISMEEILSSIRQYVSTNEKNKDEGKIIKLSDHKEEYNKKEKQKEYRQIEEHDKEEEEKEETKKKKVSPFAKIYEMKKKKESSAKDILYEIVFDWIEKNPEFIEEAIERAIKKELKEN